MNYSNIKLKLIGYYTGENQNMNPEKRFPSEAEELANLLAKTFNETFASVNIDRLNDRTFVESLSSSSVYIFKDEEKNLYAYFPKKQMARLSSVMYDKKNIRQVPLELKSWFVPGSKITLLNTNKKKNLQNDRQSQITLVDIGNEIIKYSSKDLSLSTVGKDFLIHFKSKTYPLDWSENAYISILNLKKLIMHKWVYLDEIFTDSECDDCDGYDYSDCDMTRCKDDCEHCGGRTYICNDGCFYHRYKQCVKIRCCESTIEDETSEAFQILEQINTPHSLHNQILLSNKELLDKLYCECKYITNYLGCLLAEKYIEEYDLTLKKEDDRKLDNKNVIKVTFRTIGKIYQLADKDIYLDDCGFLWLKKKIVLKGYDFISDDYVKTEHRLKLPNKKKKEYIYHTMDDLKTISEIVIVQDDDNNVIDIVFR